MGSGRIVRMHITLHLVIKSNCRDHFKACKAQTDNDSSLNEVFVANKTM